MSNFVTNTVEGTFTDQVKEITAIYFPTEELLQSNKYIIKADGGCTCGGKIIPRIKITNDSRISATFGIDSKTKKEDTKIIIVYFNNGDREFLYFKYKIV